MVNYSFHLALWTVLFFSLGMYKPQWPLFFVKAPTRFMIVVITTILVMITFTMYGEGIHREKLEKEAKAAASKGTTPHSTPVPVPAPTTSTQTPAPENKATPEKPEKPEPAKRFM